MDEEFLFNEINELRDTISHLEERVRELEKNQTQLKHEAHERYEDIYHNIDALFERIS